MTVTNLLSAFVRYNHLFENTQIRYDRVWPMKFLTSGVARKSPGGGGGGGEVFVCKFTFASFAKKSFNIKFL